MKKYILRTYRFPMTMLLVLAGTLLLLSACPGGGGTAGGGGISYTGVTTPASLTAFNANIMFSEMWNGGSSSAEMGPISLAPAFSQAGALSSLKNSGARSFVKRLSVRLSGDVAGLTAASKNRSRAVQSNETSTGKVSGTKTVTSSIDADTGKGTLTITYVNFNDWEVNTYDGVVTIKIDGYDSASQTTTDITVSFTSWTISWSGGGVSLNGSMRLQDSPLYNAEILTINMDGRDNISNETFRFENFVDTIIYDNFLNPVSASETYSGRMYAGKYGYVDISTGSPCIYSHYSNSDSYPELGGPIILSGAGSSKANITPLSPLYVRVEVDANGDAVFESGNAYLWSNITGQPLSSACIADAGPDQSVSVGSLVSLDGSWSVDLSGGELTYAWTMASKPAGSRTGFSSDSSSVTTFTADVPGTYEISLVVNNGTTVSSPDTVIITVNGSALMANAGPDQYVSTGATVTLDGSASYNATNIPLTYSWILNSKPAGSIASLANATTVHPSFIADMAGIYTINLTVSNGYATGTPDMVIITATGSQ